MKNVSMRFGGYTFRHNPAKLRIDDEANIVRLISPCTPPDSIALGRKLRVITGEGELYGADCTEQYCGLHSLYEKGSKGLLSLPNMPPVYAYLRELRLIAEPSDDVLSFSFGFIEARGGAEAVTPEDCYTVRDDGESLWDIAYACGSSVDELVRLNPQIRYIGCLSAGEKVRIC